MEKFPASTIEPSVIPYQLLIMFSVLIRQFPAIAPDMPFVASPALVGHHLMNDMVARIQSECSIEGLSFRIVCFFRDSLSVDNLPMAVDVSMVFIFFHFIAQYFKELYSKKRAINKKTSEILYLQRPLEYILWL